MLKRLLFVTLIAIFLISAKGSPLMRLTVINKSGTQLALSIRADDRSKNYYLKVPYGDRQRPSETTFTIEKDYYRMRVFYLEDAPSYTGYECKNLIASRLYALRNIRVVITECDREPPTKGEPSIIKFGKDPCVE